MDIQWLSQEKEFGIFPVNNYHPSRLHNITNYIQSCEEVFISNVTIYIYDLLPYITHLTQSVTSHRIGK